MENSYSASRIIYKTFDLKSKINYAFTMFIIYSYPSTATLSSTKKLIVEPAGGAPLLSKFGNLSNLSIQKLLVVTSAYARTDSGGGGGKSKGNPTGVENASFSWGEIARCFWATAFFLGGNRMTIVAFE